MLIPNDTRVTKDQTDAIAKKSKAEPKKKAVRSKKESKILNVIDSAKSELKTDDRLAMITDRTSLDDYVKAVIAYGEVALDTETTGLNPINDYVVGVCLYSPGLKAVYVPIGHTDGDGNLLKDQLSKSDVAAALDAMRVAGVRFIFHNSKFDIRFIRHSLGVYLSPYFDTATAGNYLNENEPHKLKYLYSKYVLQTDGSESNFSDLFEDIPFNMIPPEVGYLYAAGDALKTYELYTFQRPYLEPDSELCNAKGLVGAASFYHNVEIPLTVAVADMEDLGVCLDMDKAKELSAQYAAAIEKVRAECNSFIAGVDFSKLPAEKRAKLDDPINLSSPLQLAIVIYDVLNLTSPDKIKPRGTGADILERFTTDKRSGKLFTSLLKYRELTKLLSTYIDKLPTVVNKNSGRIHASFNAYGAKTGRFSSSEPNLQNIPASDKAIRRMFMAAPGNVFISCDYSQQEPRVLAHLSNDAKLIDAYKHNRDLYSSIASEVYKVPYDECKELHPDGSKNETGKKRRNAIKIVVLGIMYGMGAKSVANGIGVTVADAQDILDSFFTAFPNVRSYVQMVRSNAKANSYVSTVLGRKRRLPDIQLPPYEFYKGDTRLNGAEEDYFYRVMRATAFNDKDRKKAEILSTYGVRVVDNGGKIAEAERQSVNSIIQGTSADITKIAMLSISRDERLKKLSARMVLTVHDEIIVEAPYEHRIEVSDIMRELMIDAAKSFITVPMKVDSEIATRWYGESL